MCGIAGFLLLSSDSDYRIGKANNFLAAVLEDIAPRGRDVFGWQHFYRNDAHVRMVEGSSSVFRDPDVSDDDLKIKVGICPPAFGVEGKAYLGLYNFRGVPTTETTFFGEVASQPYSLLSKHGSNWASLVHNGQIANSESLISAFRDDRDYEWPKPSFEDGRYIDSYGLLAALSACNDYSLHARRSPLRAQLEQVDGSYAFAYHDTAVDRLILGRTYLGLAVAFVTIDRTKLLVWSSDYESLKLRCAEFAASFQVEEFPLNSALSMNVEQLRGYFRDNYPHSDSLRYLLEEANTLNSQLHSNRVVVVCSGGLDSTVTAMTYAEKDVALCLMHFRYGCKAERNELQAVHDLYEHIRDIRRAEAILEPVHLKIVDLSFLKELGHSTLTDDEQEVGEGEQGARKALDWVPARNLAMIGLAAAYCDANEMGVIALGLNREESGAYIDNSSEFFESLNKPLWFGTQSKPRIACPLGNMMKSHIVLYGETLKTPFHLTWSCYNHSDEKIQCGKCGPCLNTKRAFKMAGVVNPHTYKDESI